MESPTTIQEYEAQKQEIRAASHKRRAEAWAMVPETVLGLELMSLTPARYSILRGIENAYLTGRIPKEGDLRDFVWFCSPQFNPDSPISSLKWKPFVMWRLKLVLGYFSLRDRDHVLIKNFYRACLEIHTIIDTTFGDAGPNGIGEPVAASLEAQVVDVFAREYQMWPLPTPIRHTPIKQLNQLVRCIERKNLGSDDKYFDREEHRLTLRFLEVLNRG